MCRSTAIFYHLWLSAFSLILSGCSQSLEAPYQETDSVTWYDDYFTVEYIDSQTIAIGEPRYHQQSYSYLILGEERALLFDSGPGVRNIQPVVASLTELPITVTQSHFHYDHVGNHNKFDGTIIADLPSLRERAEEGELELRSSEHLGFVEGIDKPHLAIAQWVPINSYIELGGRSLQVLHSPGHTRESVVLLDKERGQLFTGDFLCPGPNLAALPGSSIKDYLQSTNKLLSLVTADAHLLTGHRDEDSVKFGAPVLGYDDLSDFKDSLEQIIAGAKEGKGFYVKSYKVNERIEFIVDE